MKKLILLGFAIILFTACENNEARFTTSSANIDEVRSLIKDYEDGNWNAWQAHYADSAKIYHNTWAKGATPQETIESLKSILANVSTYHFDKGKDTIFYEQIIDDGGKTWVNFWGNWRATLKGNNKELQIPVQLSLQMDKGKIVQEYGFYNVSDFTAELQKIEAANNMPVDQKAIMAKINSFIDIFLNKKDNSVLSDILSDDYVRYMNGAKVSSGAKELVSSLNVFFTGFPDFKISILHKSIRDNDVFVHWGFTGTNTGEFAGYPATGKKAKIEGLSRLHFNGDGKMSEENVYFDQLGLMQQLGHGLTPPN